RCLMARCLHPRRACSRGAESGRVRHLGADWPGCVATYSCGGWLAQTPALIEAQAQAVFFSSASSSCGLGARCRPKMSDGPGATGLDETAGMALGRSQRDSFSRPVAMEWRMRGVTRPGAKGETQASCGSV